MRHVGLITAIGVMVGLGWPASSQAQVPSLIRYQGTLVDTNNVPLEGTYNLTFRVYKAAAGGAALWTETQSGLSITRGVFNVLLGQATPMNLPFDADYWLSTQVGIDPEMSPRQRLTSVPYAQRANVAEQLSSAAGFDVDAAGTLTNNLVAYWKLDETSGIRKSLVGPEGLTDNNTVTSNPGKQGKAAQCTSANSEYLSIADNAALSMGDIDFTIAFWFYQDSDVTAKLIGKGGTSKPTREYFIQRNVTDGGLFASVGNGTTGSPDLILSASLSTGAWYFVILEHDAAANTLTMRLNNSSSSSVSYDGGSYDSGGEFVIGTTPTDHGDFFNGRIDEVGIWKRVLTVQERADLYNGGSGNTYSLAKSVAWTENASGIFYDGGNIGVGATSPTNILTVQQGSATDPIADSWLTYPSDRQHKRIIRTLPRTGRAGYLDEIKQLELYEWTRIPKVREREIRDRVGNIALTSAERDNVKLQLIEEKTKLPKFKTRRVGVAIDDADIPPEILAYDPDGQKAGIDLLAYVGYLHAALKEAALRIDELESRLPAARNR